MQNAKIVGAFAVAGFLLSFVSGLFSGGGVGRVIGMAVLFGLVFALLGVAIVWLTKGLMATGGSGGGDASSADDNTAADKNAKPGSVIDVVVKDDELPSEENAPRFFVGDNHQMLNDSDYGAKRAGPDLLSPATSVGSSAAASSAPAASSAGGAATSAAVSDGGTASTAPSASSSGVVGSAPGAASSGASPAASSAPKANEPQAAAPLPATDGLKFEPITLGKEKLQSKSASDKAAPAATHGDDALAEELDEIPEFQGFATVQDDGSARNIAGEMIEDSSFSQAGAPVKKKEPQTEPQDAALMAKAISTVLANDNRG